MIVVGARGCLRFCQQLSVHTYRPYVSSANTHCMIVAVVVVMSNVSSTASLSLQASDSLFLIQRVSVLQVMVAMSAASGVNV